MHYLIAGGTGFIGKSLIENLLNQKHKITILTRNIANAKKIFGKKVILIDDISQIAKDALVNCIINLAGEPIADKKWSRNQKEVLLQSRVKATKKIIDLIAALKIKPGALINASAIGYYGNCNDYELDENSLPKEEFTCQLCLEWEKEALKAEQFGVRTCIIRLGIVLGKNGGALRKMLPAFKMGLGGKIGNGRQFMSWIHICDVILAINFLLNKPELYGVFNFTAPNPVRNFEFSKSLAQTLNRPAFLKTPAFAVKMLFGEMGKALLLEGQKVLPTKLLTAGYKFKYENLNDALSEIYTQT
jgi:uncharacterized protein (TIGR01777 family)